MNKFGILFVCTGNICRSPTAEAVFRHRAKAAGHGGRFRIDSAGTHGYHAGEPPDSRSIAAAHGRGVKMDDLRARQLIRDDFRNFDLILAMDSGHYQAMERLVPAGERSADLKMFLSFAPSDLRDVPDPYYGGAQDFEQVLDLVEQGVDGLLNHLSSR